MADGDAIQALLVAGPFTPRAALEATSAICNALDEHHPTPGGRPLSASSVLLFANGDVILQDIEGANGTAVAQLLVHMLLGGFPASLTTEEVLSTVSETLRTAGSAPDWIQKLTDLMATCLSSIPGQQPSLHRIQQRCTALSTSAIGEPLHALIPQRVAATRSWMNLPSAAAPSDSLNKAFSAQPTPLPPTPPPTRPAPSTSPPSKPLPPVPPPVSDGRGWKIIAIAAGCAALVVVGLVIDQLRTPAPPDPSTDLSTAETPATNQLTDKYQLDDNQHVLALTSTPPGASVTMDGTSIGQTPLEIDALTAGVHRIALKVDDHEMEQTLMIDQDASCVWAPEQSEEPWRCETSGESW